MNAMAIDNTAIRVLGKAEEGIMRRLLKKDFTSAKNSGWFFIDYSSYDFPLQSKFNLLLTKDTLEANIHIVLRTVIDSFGNRLEDGIPRGFKTVAEFLFQGIIPVQLQTLPALTGWQSTADETWLSHIDNIKLDDHRYIDDLYKLILFDLQNEGSDLGSVYEEELIAYFLKRKITDSEQLLDTLVLRGLIKKTNEKVLKFEMVD